MLVYASTMSFVFDETVEGLDMKMVSQILYRYERVQNVSHMMRISVSWVRLINNV